MNNSIRDKITKTVKLKSGLGEGESGGKLKKLEGKLPL